MQKLLSIFSSFDIRMPSSLSIVSCFDSIKNSYDDPNETDTSQKELNVKNNEDNNIPNNQSNNVNNNYKQEENNKLNTTNITNLTDQQKVDTAVQLIQAFNNQEFILETTEQKIIILQDVIKLDKKYTKTVELEVILKEDKFVFEKLDGTVLTSESIVPVDEFLHVKGTFQSADIEKNFAFTIKLIDSDQQKVNNAVEKLQDEIEKSEEYQECINQGVRIKENKFVFKLNDQMVLC